MAITVTPYELSRAVGMTIISSDETERVDYLMGVAGKPGEPLAVEVMKVSWDNGKQDEGEIIFHAELGVE